MHLISHHHPLVPPHLCFYIYIYTYMFSLFLCLSFSCPAVCRSEVFSAEVGRSWTKHHFWAADPQVTRSPRPSHELPGVSRKPDRELFVFALVRVNRCCVWEQHALWARAANCRGKQMVSDERHAETKRKVFASESFNLTRHQIRRTPPPPRVESDDEEYVFIVCWMLTVTLLSPGVYLFCTVFQS